MLKQFCDHLVIASRNHEKALGDAMDLQHTLAFCRRQTKIEACTNDKVKDADIIVVTASVNVGTEKLTSRMQLAEHNIPMFRELIPLLAEQNPDAMLLIVTNPVDVMTYAAFKLSGFPANRIMGVGTLVDSARFREMLSQQEHIHPDDLRTYILGEHGANQFPMLSSAQAGGELIGDTEEHRKIFSQVIQAAFDVYHYKGYTNYAIATATSVLIEAIIFDEHWTMPVSTPFSEWQGIKNNCFSIPVVVGRTGVIRHLHPALSVAEQQTLETVATEVKKSIETFVPDLI